MVVGGYAVMKYAEPRYTKDMDLWIDATPKNARGVFKALKEFEAPLANLTEADFSREGFFYQMGRENRKAALTPRSCPRIRTHASFQQLGAELMESLESLRRSAPDGVADWLARLVATAPDLAPGAATQRRRTRLLRVCCISSSARSSRPIRSPGTR